MLTPTGDRFLECADIMSWGRVVRQPQHVARVSFRDELPSLVSEPGWKSKLAIGFASFLWRLLSQQRRGAPRCDGP